MDDRQTYETRKAAQRAADAMAGIWPEPHPVQIEDDPRPLWVVTVDPDDARRQPRFLRTDGYIR